MASSPAVAAGGSDTAQLCSADTEDFSVLSAKALAGGAAACVSAVVVNPFDVVKTRQQVAASGLSCVSGCPRVLNPRAVHALEARTSRLLSFRPRLSLRSRSAT